MNRTTAPNSAAGLYVDDDPDTSTIGTLLTAEDRNAIQEELIELIDHAGLTPSAADLTQVRQAVVALIDAITGSSILSKLLTVDGPGSGLDADTVDGIQASSLVKIGKWKYYNNGGAAWTMGDVYDVLAPFVPAVGDACVFIGGGASAGSVMSFITFERMTSTTIKSTSINSGTQTTWTQGSGSAGYIAGTRLWTQE